MIKNLSKTLVLVALSLSVLSGNKLCANNTKPSGINWAAVGIAGGCGFGAFAVHQTELGRKAALALGYGKKEAVVALGANGLVALAASVCPSDPSVCMKWSAGLTLAQKVCFSDRVARAVNWLPVTNMAISNSTITRIDRHEVSDDERAANLCKTFIVALGLHALNYAAGTEKGKNGYEYVFGK